MNNPPMEKIVSRDSIVKRQAAKVEKELAEAVKHVNNKLNAADSLPVEIPEAELGTTEWVRREVENRLRDAGWKVNAIAEKGKPTVYQVQ